ncbi:type II toxin-antitoxin system PemK/MazF family toxin [Moraxellaceae bacterium AER2_44_116]|nr:type II toxin-antitoxin system PemK/MazF family toxin [Moraxellaceae bacterium]TQC98763.1 type II toxin-antitoxin system PemK/MazF family toxin [Moraxellaceae bacterium AER2_44_116]
MNRGDVYFIDFDPAVGEEIQKTRPAVIVSNDSINAKLQRVQVLPLTSNIQKIYSNEALVVVAGKQGKALASQLTTVSKQRIGRKLGVLSLLEMAAIDRAIRWQLDL